MKCILYYSLGVVSGIESSYAGNRSGERYSSCLTVALFHSVVSSLKNKYRSYSNKHSGAY